MANAIEHRWNESKQRLSKLQEDVAETGARLRDDLERGQQIALGRLHDTGLGYLYGIGHAAVRTAANLAERLPALETPGKRWSELADELDQARQSLNVPPIDDYDELNVRQVEDALDGLNAWQLQKVAAYEADHKDRVTVHRAVNRRLGESAD